MAAPERAIRVAHITPTLSRRGGGVASFVCELAQRGLGRRITPTVAGLYDRLAAEDLAAYPRLEPHLFRCRGPRALGFSPGLRRFLDTVRVDLVHAHGLRMLPAYEARRLALMHGLPRVVSPHGQLDPWIMQYGRLRKRVIGLLYEDSNLRTASCLHATAGQEAQHIRAHGLNNPIAIVPIGLDTPPRDPAAAAALEQRWPELRGKKRLLFLSVIYRKKGLLTLAEAWAKLHRDRPDWHLVVTGVEMNNDRRTAEKILADAGAAAATTFTGPATGPLKQQVLSGCDLFVLPTQGENFGIVIGEALAAELPVITTVTTPWAALKHRECGWWIEPGLDPLCDSLKQAMALSDAQRREMGRRGRRLIEETCAWPTVIGRMRQVYDWLLGGGDRPPFVYMGKDPIPDD